MCRSARITASLSPYWHWLEPSQDPLARLDLALAAAQRNQDQEGENLVRNAIAALASREEFKEIQSLVQESDKLNSFEFTSVTVNRRGEEIKREAKQAKYFREILPNDVPLEMVYIPGGEFMMGSPEKEGYDYDDEKPQHLVTVSPFFMGKYPITQAQWKAIASRTDLKVERDLDSNPAYFRNRQDSAHRPVEKVSWYDAVEFCLRLSRHTGGEYRLPSEAEWEYACRAGTTTPFHFGETISIQLANYNTDYTYEKGVKGEYLKQTTPVEYFQEANKFGLCEMHGNVWEWCEDDWHEHYEGAPTDGSAWLSDNNGTTKVVRGGSCGDHPYLCRCASRGYDDPGLDLSNGVGLRVVCALGRILP
ncbi:MAG: formylglycine-generating enzyme family protein [Symploca sp. SIO1C4]|uniref:Formylglycine-generating enzyme family protein n=1 Tax=Symploca sp. SIO1C4 TaxID=2607765 RepID=A0A6B3MZS7_9CYAN|nr:formylglycine-generating enzyme family protein [Symploca sp. SIO1C4]